MSHIYLTSDDLKIGISQGRLTIKSRDDADKEQECEERDIPLATVDSINVFGGSQLSTQLIRQCLTEGIPIGYFSEEGHYFGRISAFATLDPERQKKQVLLTDNKEFCLTWSKAVIAAKILNSLALLHSMSNIYSFSESELHGIVHSLKALDEASSVDIALGFEGNAAKTYFQCLSKLICVNEFAFQGRSTRPPKDPVNAMLSYGYSLFHRNIIGAIERHGLHPYFGFMHKIKRGHAALASDLIEVLRAPLVDKTVLALVNSGEISVNGFTQAENGGIYMSRSVMKSLTDALTSAMNNRLGYFSAYDDGKKYSFQSMLDKKICSVIEAVENHNAKFYTPIIWENEHEQS